MPESSAYDFGRLRVGTMANSSTSSECGVVGKNMFSETGWNNPGAEKDFCMLCPERSGCVGVASGVTCDWLGPASSSDSDDSEESVSESSIWSARFSDLGLSGDISPADVFLAVKRRWTAILV